MEKLTNLEKKQFIVEQCMLMSYQAGVQTRNKNYPVFNKLPDLVTTRREIRFQPDNTSNIKSDVFVFLDNYLSEIQAEGINEEVHLLKIEKLADILTFQFKAVLHEGRFRIGISQKIINLFLKFMWSMNEIPEPCHCPMDGIVKSLIPKDMQEIPLVDWTKLDSLQDYKEYVESVKKVAAQKVESVAEWELRNWRSAVIR